ncbi:hypothetical protein HD554DRAFT_2037697 [Boletus coccyginus]|nr:hypothetical protein HD554DRAFT_2037697 [Boletus coccyginus]
MSYEVELEDGLRVQVLSSNGHDWSDYHEISSDYAIILAAIKSNQMPKGIREQFLLTRWRNSLMEQITWEIKTAKAMHGRVDEEVATVKGPGTETTAEMTDGESLTILVSSQEPETASREVDNKTVDTTNLNIYEEWV